MLNDGTGSNGTISLGNSVTINTTSTTDTINVGNNGSSNTGNTVGFGALSNGSGGAAVTINFTGANGYLESFSSLALAGAGGNTTVLNPTSTSVTITGNVTNQETFVAGTHYDTLQLGGTSTGNLISGIISDSGVYASVNSGDTRVTMSGTGSWTLAGANTYHGPTAISAGTLNLTGSLANTQSVTTSGAGIFTEGSTGAIGGAATFAQGSTGTSVLGGTNTYTGATTVSAGVLSLTGSLGSTAITTSGTGVFSEGTTGSIGGNASFTQNSSGLSLFSGTNTYTGATTVSAGILEFGNTAAQPTGLTTVGTGGTLALAVGGAGQFTGAQVNQYLANTLPRVNSASNSLGIDTTAGNFNLGGLTLPTNTSSSINKLGANALNLGAITRNAGSTVNFAITTGALNTETANTGGSILGGYATFGGSTWAVSAGSPGNPGAITGLATYTTSATAGTVAASYAGADIDVTASETLAGAITPNSLRFNTAAGNTLTLTGTNVIATGGILNTSAVGNNGSTIAGGTLEGSAGGELIVINNDTQSAVTISSVIANNTTATGLTKSGLGTLNLSATNTYTGATVIDAGTLQLVSGKILNTSGVVASAGATLSFNDGNGGGSESGLIGGVVSGAGGVTDNEGNPNTSFFLDKANTYTGPTTINNRGVLFASTASAYDGNGNLISGALGVNSAFVISCTGGGATLVLGSNTQVGSLAGGVAGSGINFNNFNLITGGDNTSTTFSGQIAGGAIPGGGSGAARNIGGNLTKIGTGTQILTGAQLLFRFHDHHRGHAVDCHDCQWRFSHHRHCGERVESVDAGQRDGRGDRADHRGFGPRYRRGIHQFRQRQRGDAQRQLLGGGDEHPGRLRHAERTGHLNQRGCQLGP